MHCGSWIYTEDLATEIQASVLNTVSTGNSVPSKRIEELINTNDIEKERGIRSVFVQLTVLSY